MMSSDESESTSKVRDTLSTGREKSENDVITFILSLSGQEGEPGPSTKPLSTERVQNFRKRQKLLTEADQVVPKPVEPSTEDQILKRQIRNAKFYAAKRKNKDKMPKSEQEKGSEPSTSTLSTDRVQNFRKRQKLSTEAGQVVPKPVEPPTEDQILKRKIRNAKFYEKKRKNKAKLPANEGEGDPGPSTSTLSTQRVKDRRKRQKVQDEANAQDHQKQRNISNKPDVPPLPAVFKKPNYAKATEVFQVRFRGNPLGSVCDVCHRVWFKRDLTIAPIKTHELLQTAFPEEDVATFLLCSSCKTSLITSKRRKITDIL